MKKTYHELSITPSSDCSYFIDFIFALGFEGIEEKGGSIIIRSEDSLDTTLFALEEYAKKLSLALDKNITLQTSLNIKENEDWIKKYKNSVHPISVGKFYIRPDWEEAKDSKINIIINPALAFGSGHHESTYGCILQLQKFIKKDDTLLDVGCGSGILSIVGAKLGAIVDICDTDELAISSAKENFAINSENIEDAWVGSVQLSHKTYGVVVANIIADILIMLANDLIKKVKKDGYLILSGILDKYIDKVEDKFSTMRTVEKYKKNEWFTLVLQRQ
jgi:ribosomal protein L11 methyltransferase